MTKTDKNLDPVNKPTLRKEADSSVSSKILSSFTDALAELEGMSEVATRLNEAIIEKKQINERSLKEALFGKTP